MTIDLRSDTVTRPGKAMLDAMFSAGIGDDVFGEDPTVNELETHTATLFGKEAGLFCPSGTMSNQLAIKSQSVHGQEIICDQQAHVYLYEGGGLAFNSGLSVALIPGERGRLSAAQVSAAIRASNVHFPETAVVALENTHNRGGGSIYSLDEIKAIRKVCDANNLRLHLDGARIFNALVESDYSAADIGKQFDTISVCLSKGIGAPIGSVLVGDAVTLARARRFRKVLGGGMRQAGFLAAAGLYGLRNNISRLKDDHRRARILGETMASLSVTEEVIPVDTNIVVTRLKDMMPLDKFLAELDSRNIKAAAFGPQAVRMVTHLDFDDTMLEQTVHALKQIS